jgi:hypothetical protein
MRPILDDAYDAIGADADEDVRPVFDLHNARLPNEYNAQCGRRCCGCGVRFKSASNHAR